MHPETLLRTLPQPHLEHFVKTLGVYCRVPLHVSGHPDRDLVPEFAKITAPVKGPHPHGNAYEFFAACLFVDNVASARGLRLAERNGLVNEHDGYIVLDLILQPAGVTDESVLVLRQDQVSFALGTHQYLQQLLIYSHHSLHRSGLTRLVWLAYL